MRYNGHLVRAGRVRNANKYLKAKLMKKQLLTIQVLKKKLTGRAKKRKLYGKWLQRSEKSNFCGYYNINESRKERASKLASQKQE